MSTHRVHLNLRHYHGNQASKDHSHTGTTYPTHVPTLLRCRLNALRMLLPHASTRNLRTLLTCWRGPPRDSAEVLVAVSDSAQTAPSLAHGPHLYVELDPFTTDAAREFRPSEDVAFLGKTSRLCDPVRWMSLSPCTYPSTDCPARARVPAPSYCVTVIALPEPSTARINQFYTT